MEIGFVMPTVRIRDSIHLRSNEYVLKVRGEEVNRSEVMPDRLLAVNSGAVIQNVAGIAAKDPVFGLDALWVEAGDREAAERAGFTVIEPSAVLSTHLSEVVRAHAADLLSRQDVQTLLDNAKAHDEAVVNELVNNVLQVGDIQKVLQHLLREKVPIRDMVTILETMADFGSRVKDPEQLGELVRAAISRTITRQYLDDNNKLYCITLEPAVERDLAEKVNVTSFGSMLVLDPDEQRHLVQRLQSEVDRASAQGYQAVLICSTQLRLPLRRLAEKSLPRSRSWRITRSPKKPKSSSSARSKPLDQYPISGSMRFSIASPCPACRSSLAMCSKRWDSTSVELPPRWGLRTTLSKVSNG